MHVLVCFCVLDISESSNSVHGACCEGMSVDMLFVACFFVSTERGKQRKGMRRREDVKCFSLYLRIVSHDEVLHKKSSDCAGCFCKTCIFLSVRILT